MSFDNVSLRWFLRSPLGWTLIASTLGVLLYTLWILLFSLTDRPIIEETEAVISSLMLIALGSLVTLLGLYLIHLTRDNLHLQIAWWLLTLAIFSSVIADCVWFYYESVLFIDPFPSIADIFYLLYYPLTLLGVLALPFAPFDRRERVTLFLDLAIVLTSAAMVFWYYLVAPLQFSPSANLERLIAISYPVADLLLLAGIVALVQRDIQRVAWWTLSLFACALIFNAAADTLYAFFENNGIAYWMAHLNILWMAWLLLLAYSFAIQIRGRESPVFLAQNRYQPTRRLLQVMLPYAAAVVSLILLFFLIRHAEDITLRLQGMLYGSLVLVAFVLTRQSVVLHQNSKLVEELRVMATTDSLTRIYNRHFFNEVFRLKIQQADRYARPLSILLMDVDGFKQINDTFGHLKGDDVLRDVARLLSSQLRSTDLIARFGGDEFVVILPETDYPQAQKVAARLKTVVATQHLEGVPMGVSIGVAIYHSGQSPEEVLDTADKDLYSHKAGKPNLNFYGSSPNAHPGQPKTLYR